MLSPDGFGPSTRVSREALSYPEGALGRERHISTTRNIYRPDTYQSWYVHPGRDAVASVSIKRRPYIGDPMMCSADIRPSLHPTN